MHFPTGESVYYTSMSETTDWGFLLLNQQNRPGGSPDTGVLLRLVSDETAATVGETYKEIGLKKKPCPPFLI